jgi:formamidopyrimidine-DNA glycosylase
MPELPEVETVRRHLARRVIGRRVKSVRTSGLKLRKPLPRDLIRESRGGQFVAARRVAKFLFLDWESRSGDRSRSLMAHLGMTGHFLYRKDTPHTNPPHTHVEWRFEDGSSLVFCDTRRFGLFEWVARDARPAGVGIDPTETHPTGEMLHAMIGKSRTPVKSFLLDQRKIAGLGNIYASEALFRAGISPRRICRTISRDEADRLAVAIMDALREAVRYKGTSFSDFRDLDDQPGENRNFLRVYGREGKPCHVCKTPIRRFVQAGRSTFFCPQCQRKARIRAASATPR